MRFFVDIGNMGKTTRYHQVPGRIVPPLSHTEPKRKVWFTREAMISVW